MPDQDGTPAPSFGDMVGSLAIPLDTQEAVDLRQALDSTGTLKLGKLSPAAVGALDGLWASLAVAGAPKVSSIIFPEGMAEVPPGVRTLPHLERIELPRFEGELVHGGLAGPLAITIHSASSKLLKFVISNSDTIIWSNLKERPWHWTVSNYDQQGNFIDPPTCHEPQRIASSANVNPTADYQRSIIAACQTSKGTKALIRKKWQPSKRDLMDAWTLILWRPVDKKKQISLLQHLQRNCPPIALENFLVLLVSMPALTPADKTMLLMKAMVPTGQPVESDLQLPDQVADIIKKMPDSHINPDLLRLVTPCCLQSRLHDWVRSDAAEFSRLVAKVIASSTSALHLGYLLGPDLAGRTPLHVAAADGWSEAANGLITQVLAAKHLTEEARTLVVREMLGAKTKDGDTLLWHAAARGEEVCSKLQLLLREVILSGALTQSDKFLLIAKLLRIERPRPALIGIVQDVALEAVLAAGDDGRSDALNLTFLIDLLTATSDGISSTMLHDSIETNGRSSLIPIVAAVASFPKVGLDGKLLPYLLARTRHGRTALHCCSLRNDATQVKEFVNNVLNLSPQAGDLAQIWTAPDDNKHTPFWAAIDARAFRAAAAWLELAASARTSKQPLARALVESVVRNIDRATEVELKCLLSARDNDGKGLLHTLVASKLHDAMTFVANRLLARNFNEDTMEALWTDALQSDPSGPSLLVEALAHRKVLDELLGCLIETKKLSADGKQRLLALLLKTPNGTIDRHASLPISMAVMNSKDTTDGWKIAQQVMIDLLTRGPEMSGKPTQLHLVAVKSADTARPRIRPLWACCATTSSRPQRSARTLAQGTSKRGRRSMSRS
ncbi:hypothetical protein ASC98_22600 [Rhizobacter sp. Root1238]|nr:hypothetical protein ASC98_22600 [Rhizobacter sp. Root1238]